MATLGPLANFQDIDGILWGGWRWTDTNLTYSFPTTINDYQFYNSITGFQAFNARQKADAARAVEMVDAVCGLTITFTTVPGAGNLRFAECNTYDPNDGDGPRQPGGGLSAESNPPDDDLFVPQVQGDSWFTHGNYENPVIGQFQSAAGIIHELGHALGLKHGHGINKQSGPGANSILLPRDHDSQEYSVMTYRAWAGQPQKPNGQFDLAVEYPSTLMQNDIFALQWLYGPDYAYNGGNTIYSWSPATGEMLVNNQRQNMATNIFGGVTFHNKIFMTVWDGGGIDTYNFANYATPVKVNLNPGEWSTPNTAQLANLGSGHFARGSIANALAFANEFRPYIENAIGGTNNDAMVGNVLANRLTGNRGNDSLNGLAGNDILTGGAGRDVLRGAPGRDTFDFNFVLESGKFATTADLIADFTRQQGDKIDLLNIDARTNLQGNQAFALIGQAAFHDRSGELRVSFLNQPGTSRDKTVIEGDVNGDGVADFRIYLTGLKPLAALDFIL